MFFNSLAANDHLLSYFIVNEEVARYSVTGSFLAYMFKGIKISTAPRHNYHLTRHTVSFGLHSIDSRLTQASIKGEKPSGSIFPHAIPILL